jgi:hypothetical protein
MNWLDRFRNKKVKGAELVVTGGIVIFFAEIVVGYLAPIALCGYGLYRWFIRKRYNEGIVAIAIGILLLVLLRGPLLFLQWIPYAVGAILMVYGAFLMVMPGDQHLNNRTGDDADPLR